MLTYVNRFGRTMIAMDVVISNNISSMGRVSSPFFLSLLVLSLPTLTLELTMDTDKWKSIAVPIETWKKLNELAKENFRTVGGTITYLTQKEYESEKKLVDEKV